MIFSTGLAEPEAPLFLDDGRLLVVEMGPDRGCITRIATDGSIDRVLARTGRPNGLALDHTGCIWIAESGGRALLRMSPNGNIENILDSYGNHPFLFPNDVAFAPDGALFLTDSGILLSDFVPDGALRPDWHDAPVDGRVYRIDIATSEITLVDQGMRFTNGVAVGPDGYLYANETLTGNIFRYQLDGHCVGPRELFANVLIEPDAEVLRGPDGMKFAANGDLYVAVFGQGDITVLNRKGLVTRRIKTLGNSPSNLAFGPNGSHNIYVTEDEIGTIEVLEAGVGGYELYDGTPIDNTLHSNHSAKLA